MPGFVDMHGHIGGQAQGANAEYVFKLWLGHGITTIRDPSCGNGLDWVLEHRAKSNRNEITAPRIQAYTVFGQGAKEPISTPEQARAWVQQNAKRGADGIKFFGAEPDYFSGGTGRKQETRPTVGLPPCPAGSGPHECISHCQSGPDLARTLVWPARSAIRRQNRSELPRRYNYNNEQNRFEEAGNLWQQAAKPGTERWNKVMDELIALDFTLDPTFNIYEANRELMLARRAEWHDDYTMPSLWRFYGPSRISHGSYWHSWGTEQEVAWKKNYQLWMAFINEYKNRGGRVTAGSDSGFIYQLYGFAYIRELELLREAGFHPLEVIRAATLKGAEALGMADQIGSVEVGKLADFVIVDQNPLANLKVLYGTGAIHLNDKNEVERVGGVTYTVKDGVVYDAKKLLADVRKLVADAKQKENFEITQPGVPAKAGKVSGGWKN